MVFMIILLLNAIEIDQLTKFDLELDMNYVLQFFCLLDFVFFNPLCNRHSVTS